jgi:predicted TIM-barrel fold metal-dependent hydrolase
VDHERKVPVLPKDTQLISVDDHVVEPPNVWTDRLPSRYGDAGPHVVDVGPNRQAWIWEDRRFDFGLMGSPRTRIFHGTGDGDEIKAHHYRDMVPACYDVTERTKAMDVDGVHAALLFPTWPRFAGTLFLEAKDRDLAADCVRAWNDWLLDEWCAAAPERFIPMTMIMLWDPELAAEEMRRCAAKGARSITMCENPAPHKLPAFWTGFWDPVFAAAEETGLVLSMHIGTSGSLVSPSPESTEPVSISLCGLNSMMACTDLIFSGVLHRFPNVRIALSEGGAGWVPYLLERMDYTWERTRYETIRGLSPSELFRKHFWTCFIADETALAIRDMIGVDRLMWECDYPHNDCNWPDSRALLEKVTSGIPDDDMRRIGELNARELYSFNN